MKDVNLFLDDERVPLPGWTWVKTYNEAVAIMSDPDIRVVSMSLDHDLGP